MNSDSEGKKPTSTNIHEQGSYINQKPGMHKSQELENCKITKIINKN